MLGEDIKIGSTNRGGGNTFSSQSALPRYPIPSTIQEPGFLDNHPKKRILTPDKMPGQDTGTPRVFLYRHGRSPVTFGTSSRRKYC